MVFDRTQAGLIFAKPHLDLTNELIRRYNAARARKAAARPPSRRRQAGRPGRAEEVAWPCSTSARSRRCSRTAIRSCWSTASTIIDDERIVARKLVSRNEPHFEGHFPGHPVMPGVLIIEALAQAGALFAARLTKLRSRPRRSSTSWAWTR